MKKTKVVFMGTPIFARRMLETLLSLEMIEVVGVISQPDRPVGRRHERVMTPVHACAVEQGLPVLQPQRLRDEVSAVLSLEADLLITCAYGQMLPMNLIESVPLGCLNIHASLLPAYRGGAPIQRAIMAGEEETGICLMKTVKKMDAGEVGACLRVSITPTDTTGTLTEKLMVAGAQLLVSQLPVFLAGKMSFVAQDETKVSFAPIIRREDEHLDLTQSAKKVYDQARALLPAPAGYLMLGDQKVKIHDVCEGQGSGPAGTILGLQEGVLLVACGSGALGIRQLQFPGKKIINVKAALAGYPQLRSGSFL